MLGLELFSEVEIIFGAFRGLDKFPSLGRKGRKSEARRQHHGLLGARHHDVHAPCVHGQGVAPQGRDGVHHQDGTRPVFDHCRQLLHRVLYAGGSLVSLHQDRLDGWIAVKPTRYFLGVRRLTPLYLDQVHVDTIDLAEFSPALSKLPAFQHHGRVTGRQGVGHRPFHGAGAGSGKHEHFLLGLKEIFQVFPHLRQDVHEGWSAMVNNGLSHCQLGFRGYWSRPGGHKKSFHGLCHTFIFGG